MISNSCSSCLSLGAASSCFLRPRIRPHFGEFLVLLPRVYAEENDEDNEEDGQFLEAVRQSADGVPGRPSISQGQEKQNNASEPPEFALAFLELLEARRDDRTSAGSGRSVSSGAARV